MRTANIFNQKETSDYRVEYVHDGRLVTKQSFRLFEDAQRAVDAWMHGKPQRAWI